MHKVLKTVFKSKYLLKSFSKLMTGNAIAQIMGIISIPILTRLYSVEAYGMQAVYSSIVSVIVMFVTGKYEMAIVLPRERLYGLCLGYISLMLSILWCTVLSIVLIFTKDVVAGLFNVLELSVWLMYLPFTVFINVLYTVTFNLMNREKRYGLMSMASVVVSTANIIIAFLYAVINSGSNIGLLYATTFGQFVASIGLVCFLVREGYIQLVTLEQLRYVALKYSDFPKYFTLGQTVNSFSVQLPIFLLSSFTATETTGLFSMANRILGIPSRFIGGSVQNVYLKEANDEYLATGKSRVIFIKSFCVLLCCSLIIFIVAFCVVPLIIPMILGEAWRDSGIYCRYLCVVFFLQLIYTPLEYTSIIFGKQRIDMMFQFFRMIIVFILMMGMYCFFDTEVALIFGYVIAMLLIYGSGLYFSYIWSKGEKVGGLL